jgi:hypothetical protein
MYDDFWTKLTLKKASLWLRGLKLGHLATSCASASPFLAVLVLDGDYAISSLTKPVRPSHQRPAFRQLFLTGVEIKQKE